MRILSVSDMRFLETSADAAGHTFAKMIEQAGQGIVRAIVQRTSVKNRRVLVLTGPGNNGGDGLVAARLLKQAGAEVTTYLTRHRDAGQDPVFAKAETAGVTMIGAADDPSGETLRRLTAQADVIIDALLGIGAEPPLRDAIADTLGQVQAILAQPHSSPVISLNQPPTLTPPRPLIVAVDGPSGLNFDNGDIDPLALKAHLTVTFAAPKWGHLRFPGAEYVGELVVADIGLPASVVLPDTGPLIATPAMVRAWLPARPSHAHKGTFGKALIVAGSANYTGAAILAAEAAVRAGAGLVTLAIPNILHAAIVPAVPEATYLLLPHTLGVLDAHAAPTVAENVSHYSAMLIGPGLSHTPETTAFLRRLLGLETGKRSAGFVPTSHTEESTELPPLVIDADGLNILSETPNWPEALPSGTILTPHPGEMARLTRKSIAEVQADRLAIARESAATWGHVVVLKGAFTVIAAPGGETVLLPFANPALASAGTGDVLAGTIVALRAQGLAAFESAVCGAYLHGLAGELVREQRGAMGLAASDVVSALAEASRRLMGN